MVLYPDDEGIVTLPDKKWDEVFGREGIEFECFTTNEDGTGDEYTTKPSGTIYHSVHNKIEIKKPTVLYAQWKYKIKFVVNNNDSNRADKEVKRSFGIL